MVRHLAIAALLVLAPTYAAAQQCTSDPQQVVEEIYGRILERPTDAAGIRYWTTQLRTSTVREVIRGVAKSQEYIDLLGRERDSGRAAAKVHRHLIGRPPSRDAQAWFENHLRTHGLPETVDHLLNTEEYEKNFGEWRVPGSNVTYCGNTQNRWTAVPRGSSNDTFVAADRNRDGQITFVEFTGTREEFRRADRNRDNMLSREEFLQSTEVTAETELTAERFDELDDNRNNRVDRSEWRGSDAAFRILDRNGNGWLSRGEAIGRRR